MDLNIEFARKTALAYNTVCKSLCQELKLPQTAFDILMFLANNPEYKTASAIVEIRKLKANLVSVNVDKLVHDGYLMRKAVENDRRKTELICTEHAQPIIARGRQLQKDFISQLMAGMDEQTQQTLIAILSIMDHNLDTILKGDS